MDMIRRKWGERGVVGDSIAADILPDDNDTSSEYSQYSTSDCAESSFTDGSSRCPYNVCKVARDNKTGENTLSWLGFNRSVSNENLIVNIPRGVKLTINDIHLLEKEGCKQVKLIIDGDMKEDFVPVESLCREEEDNSCNGYGIMLFVFIILIILILLFFSKKW